MCYLSIKEQFTGRKVIPIGICTSLSCMKARRRLLWHSVKHFMDNAIFCMWLSAELSCFFFWPMTETEREKEACLRMADFLRDWQRIQCLLYSSARPEGVISRHMLWLFFFSLWSTTRRKTVSRRSWKEGKRSFFYRALKVKSVPHVCCIYCSGNRLKLSAICI